MISRRHAKENAGGVPEISRGSSESASDTPGWRPQTSRTPEECQNHARRNILRPSQGREIGARVFRGCRCAQPPANFFHPSGMMRAATADKS